MVSIGIHDLSIATAHYVLDHATLAEHHGVDVNKYLIGLGQQQMSIVAPDEDIVTLAAAAADPIIKRHGSQKIRTIVIGTETGVDQSKSAGIWVSSLLGLPSSARVLEVKQACYGATGALQLALALVHRDPTQQVLVIAADVARYDLDSPGEPTQGAAAAAMLVSADPALLRLEEPTGIYTADIMDFWRPNYRSTALVDGKASVTAYMEAASGAWKDYTERGGRAFGEFAAFCYHQPFTKMAYKAHKQLAAEAGEDASDAAVQAAVGNTVEYNRRIGNSYTASLYLALAALLDQADDLSDQPIAMLSYGSGCVAELFAGTVTPGYQQHLRTDQHRAALETRIPLSYEHYRRLHNLTLPTNGNHHSLPVETSRPFRLTAISEHKRMYGAV
ncbi:hydroxymethylglutaryl-CoA synthase [Mycobacterium marinum]|uniref:Polyketide biosynthesis 3-hydroxy-3-methylglutaryl-ACP synthase PksG n=2 Tax=Mycobacterium marinum TaxID=1781 RepID=A0A3E2MXJ5_MYCMR|nr:hydroxymethylglutaryl-CoA synthase [Mycobacterium marinum]AXN45153.1 Polyketide biosynthesis 3-hydroxy-3-methylglutaryl-ACP synthase PksG [Mycobacterium marinum]EPQ76978.1 Hydroxymethylglutaryl-CoA synthase [Mycobacterium marinum MB2]MDC8975384.1 hydroxymethylglutaryl-CoA synthase [Mycobacterium marinum]MDC8984960.1 hydroxymethylglutaryl-CoA synthase [Mycobacterium marinum]MDC8996996.1 hydroxymethylglutaryl-CoA synthase [Mycobacterium marinum]